MADPAPLPLDSLHCVLGHLETEWTLHAEHASKLRERMCVLTSQCELVEDATTAARLDSLWHRMVAQASDALEILSLIVERPSDRSLEENQKIVAKLSAATGKLESADLFYYPDQHESGSVQ